MTVQVDEESGPAAGVIAAAHVGRRCGAPDLIAFDMGGTTAKAGLVRDGRPAIATELVVGGTSSSGRRRSATGGRGGGAAPGRGWRGRAALAGAGLGAATNAGGHLLWKLLSPHATELTTEDGDHDPAPSTVTIRGGSVTGRRPRWPNPDGSCP